MDVIVIGTGLSATLLVESLCRRRCFRTLRVVGPARPLRAHRVSFWSAEPTPFDTHVDASWSRVQAVTTDARALPCPLGRFTYRSFPARAWHADSWARLRSQPGVEVIEGRAGRVTTVGNRATVVAGSSTLEADWVFTSAPDPAPSPDAVQRFEGWELAIETSTAMETPVLLDFRTPAHDDFRFMYALPLRPDRLFVEHVSYVEADHSEAIRTYLDQVLALPRWEVVDREAGATPLYGQPPVRARGRVVAIGVAAGLAKAATGYAALRMWRDAEAIAAGLTHDGAPRIRRRIPALSGLADRFFLDLLARAPDRIPELLGALFQDAPGDAVLAFLDDRANLREQLAVARATPGWMRWLATATRRSNRR